MLLLHHWKHQSYTCFLTSLVSVRRYSQIDLSRVIYVGYLKNGMLHANSLDQTKYRTHTRCSWHKVFKRKRSTFLVLGLCVTFVSTQRFNLKRMPAQEGPAHAHIQALNLAEGMCAPAMTWLAWCKAFRRSLESPSRHGFFVVSRFVFCQQISLVSRFAFCQQILSADFYSQQFRLLSKECLMLRLTAFQHWLLDDLFE